ncbi:hypothetical protein P8C59_009611 [Phyllachora maydis]|uniref:Uncharacterized protein n=1 Tax=Phyllachora maydis TaxID=1825666 RepID=A0AAD9IFQ5_9PEZI|nr:hypothetical protein P8C59_009611 [Phyllachora maydis]
MLSHTSVLNNGYLIAHRMGLDPTDLIVCPPPLFHCFGCVLGYMATATTGAAILFPSPAFDPLASVRMAADYRATGLYGVPTMFVAMLEAVAAQAQQHPAVIPDAQLRALPQHLRKGIAAGSSIPAPLMQRLYDVLGLRDLVICYGMTETSPVSCMTSPADPPAKRMASVGRAMPHTAIKIVDPADRARIVPRGARGELAVAGYLVMKGYWGDEARTREVKVKEQWAEEDDSVSGGPRPKAVMWMYSGDEARMDAEGYVEITGRIKDLIIRGGENIHPLEIETCLFQHPLIAEASVVGVPDPRLGEAVVAFVNVLKGVSVVDGEYEQSVPTPEASAAAATTTTTTTAAAAVMVGVVEEDADKASGAKCLSKREGLEGVTQPVRASAPTEPVLGPTLRPAPAPAPGDSTARTKYFVATPHIGRGTYCKGPPHSHSLIGPPHKTSPSRPQRCQKQPVQCAKPCKQKQMGKRPGPTGTH